MPKTSRLTETDAVVLAVDNDGCIRALSLELQMLAELANVATALFLALLRLINSLGDRTQGRDHHYEKQDHHGRHQVGKRNPERLLRFILGSGHRRHLLTKHMSASVTA